MSMSSEHTINVFDEIPVRKTLMVISNAPFKVIASKVGSGSDLPVQQQFLLLCHVSVSCE